MILPKRQMFNSTLKNHSSFIWLLLLFVAVHILLFNVNLAEWGDSYRILRASDSLREGFYPADEKRPPLPALIFSTRPANFDAIAYARLWLFAFSLAAFVVFYMLVTMYVQSKQWQLWAMLALLFNNVYLYWSIRIMADVPFSFFAILAMYLYARWLKSPKAYYLLLSGFVCGLAIVTRFEGYILGLAFVIGLFLADNFTNFTSTVKRMFAFGIGSLIIVLPYLLFRNPLSSSYLEEPGYRVYDVKVISIFLLSLLCVTGLSYALYFVFKHVKGLWAVFGVHKPMLLFVVLELILILAWPAAIPRLFVAIIPFLILFITKALEFYFAEQADQTARVWDFIWMFILLGIYVVGQYSLRLQFLILSKELFALSIVLQLVAIVAVVYKRSTIFVIFSIVTMLLWSYAAINLHRHIFASIQSAAVYVGEHLDGNIGYNDVSSVSDWYINHQFKKPGNKGFYYNSEKKANLDHDKLIETGIDYLLITNEHNTSMSLDLNKRPYLKELAVFEYNVNGKNFVSRVIEVL
jgi:4-amino-4-deoxy-L-arabinose transferase-like glycosyltransferase